MPTWKADMSLKSFKKCVFILLCAPFAAIPVVAKDQPVPVQKIRQLIIEDSIASYPGRCPCPYNVTRNGSVCGARSAWSRRGGHAPICYEQEVTQEMVRERQKQERPQGQRESARRADGEPPRHATDWSQL